jgi:hypothetical protein
VLDGSAVPVENASATVTVTQPATQQCTLGFWKQTQHFHFWVGFTPGQSFNAVFGTSISGLSGGGGSNPTLLQALNSGGGGVNTFARHAVAALLNASSLQTPSQSVAQVKAAVLAAFNAGPAAMQALADKFDAEQQADNCTGFINS